MSTGPKLASLHTADYSMALSESVALDLLVGSGDYDEAGYLDGATEHMNWSVALSTSAGGLDCYYV